MSPCASSYPWAAEETKTPKPSKAVGDRTNTKLYIVYIKKAQKQKEHSTFYFIKQMYTYFQ